MKKLSILIKRELWEQKQNFLYLPLVISALCIVFFSWICLTDNWQYLGIQLVFGTAGTEEFLENGFSSFIDAPLFVKEQIVGLIFAMTSVPLVGAFWLIIFIYFLFSLYQDRRDRSILFWKSMPVSDSLTVFSKLVAGLVLAPVITLTCITLLNFIVLLILSMVTTDAWATLWVPAHMFTRTLTNFIYLPLMIIWVLPIYSWILLVSSIARSMPFAWAAGIPLVVGITELIVSGGESRELGWYIGRHISPYGVLESTLGNPNLGIMDVIQSKLNLESLMGLALSALFIYGAIKFRAKAGEL